VGLTGVVVHMSALQVSVQAGKIDFVFAQTVATIIAITWNYILNNASHIATAPHRRALLTGW
jgi:putative flippase GtrA